jgi:predicted peroxiredoxin
MSAVLAAKGHPMNRSLLPVVLVLITALVLGGCQPSSTSSARSTQPAASQPARDGVFVHVRSGTGDPHSVLMALRMAEIMAADRDVLVYFDIDGIDVVLADGPNLEYETFPSSDTQLAALGEAGVTLMACPGCLEAAGKTADDLREGIELADSDRFFSFTEGRILTLDY